MAIKKYYVKNKKPGFQYDKNKNLYFSWGYDIRLDNGRRVEERGFGSRKLAESAVAKIKLDEKNSLHGFTRTRDVPFLIELFQKKLDATVDRTDRTRAKRVFNYFLALLPERIKVTDLKTAHIQEFLDARLKENVSAATVRRELVPISSALNSAYKFFAALEDYRPPRIPRPRVSRQRKTKIISQKERIAIFNYLFAPKKDTERAYQFEARRRTGLFLQFCLLTVSRPGEVAQIKKSQVDFDAGTVEIHGVKTRFVSDNIVRVLSLTPTMRDILRERFEKAQNGYLFTRGGRVTPKMYEQLKRACEANDIVYGKNKLDGITFHTARHTSTTILQQSNKVDLKTTGAFTGHSDETMTLYYTHTNQKQLEIAASILEENIALKLDNGEFLESNAVN